MIEQLTTNAFFQKILLVTLVTLLPLIPAYILFKLLPANAIVRGPFKGLNVDFSGATALYFIVFATIFTTSQFWNLGEQPPADENDYQVWTVRGTIESENTQYYTEQDFLIKVRPGYKIYPNGQFEIDVLEQPGLSGEMEFPTLTFTKTGLDTYNTHTIPLDGYKWGVQKFDIQRIDSSNTIIINDTLEIYPVD